MSSWVSEAGFFILITCSSKRGVEHTQTTKRQIYTNTEQGVEKTDPINLEEKTLNELWCVPREKIPTMQKSVKMSREIEKIYGRREA